MRIAVLIVTRDRPVTLRRCVESIFSQTHEDLEVHVLDDGSEDESIESMLTATFGECSINYYRVNRSVGATEGRNRLAERAQGDIFCFLDDDAYFESDDALEQLVANFAQYETMGVAAFKITDYREQAPRLLLPYRRKMLRQCPELPNRSRKVSYYLGCGFAVRQETFTDSGGFESFLYYGEDELDLSYRVLEKGYEIRYVPEVQVAHIPGPSLLTGEKGESKAFYHMRNRLYLLYRYIPLRYALVYAFVWGSVYAYFALRDGQLGGAIRGFIAGLKEIPAWSREPLSPEVVDYLKENHGRLWY